MVEAVPKDDVPRAWRFESTDHRCSDKDESFAGVVMQNSVSKILFRRWNVKRVVAHFGGFRYA